MLFYYVLWLKTTVNHRFYDFVFIYICPDLIFRMQTNQHSTRSFSKPDLQLH